MNIINENEDEIILERDLEYSFTSPVDTVFQNVSIFNISFKYPNMKIWGLLTPTLGLPISANTTIFLKSVGSTASIARIDVL